MASNTCDQALDLNKRKCIEPDWIASEKVASAPELSNRRRSYHMSYPRVFAPGCLQEDGLCLSIGIFCCFSIQCGKQGVQQRSDHIHMIVSIG